MTTTITDTFNRADSSASLGTTSDGSTVWTVPQGTGGIASNKGYFPVLAGGFGKAILDAGIADADAKVDVPGSSSSSGVIVRYQDTSNYWAGLGDGLYKIETGSFTKVIPGTFSGTATTLEVVTAGASLTYKVNGATIGATTSSFLVTATMYGLYAQSTADTFDNFSVSDALPPVPAYRRPAISVRTGAVRRASVI